MVGLVTSVNSIKHAGPGVGPHTLSLSTKSLLVTAVMWVVSFDRKSKIKRNYIGTHYWHP